MTRKKELVKRIRNLEATVQFNELQFEKLSAAIRRLDSVLVESGILEYDWKFTEPKTAVIKTEGYATYTKINKVF